MITVNKTEVELSGEPRILAAEVIMAAYAVRIEMNKREPGAGDKLFTGIKSALLDPEIEEEVRKEAYFDE